MKYTKPLDLEQNINLYIRHKRALGNVYCQEARLLNKLGDFLKNTGAEDLDLSSFNVWCKSLVDHHPNTRRKWQQIVRNFCLYRRRTEPECFVPHSATVTRPSPYVTPIIIESEQIARMLKVASCLPRIPRVPLQGPVLRLAIVLLYTAGLRLGELLHLEIRDVECDSSVLRIRETKFHKTRLVPLSPCNSKSRMRGYSRSGMYHAIKKLFDRSDVHDYQGRSPRIHDLRHSFAVQALIRWYKNGEDVQTNLPKLALYMGHVSIESTAYYLKLVPTLRALASRRFEEHFGHIVEGGEE
jgi:integrase